MSADDVYHGTRLALLEMIRTGTTFLNDMYWFSGTVGRALDEMGEAAERVDLAMISIDVEVDTPDVLASYVRSFVPGSVAIRTTDDTELRAAADVFGADYGKDVVDGEESVYHTGSLYVVDDQGNLLLTWPFGTPTEDIRSDLERLLDGETAA